MTSTLEINTAVHSLFHVHIPEYNLAMCQVVSHQTVTTRISLDGRPLQSFKFPFICALISVESECYLWICNIQVTHVVNESLDPSCRRFGSL